MIMSKCYDKKNTILEKQNKNVDIIFPSPRWGEGWGEGLNSHITLPLHGKKL